MLLVVLQAVVHKSTPDKVIELVSAITAIVIGLGELARRIRKRRQRERARRLRHLSPSERPTDPEDLI